MKLNILTTTALVALSLSSPVKAEENTTWFGDVTNNVKSWFATDDTMQTSADVDAYLDEVTIAVPTMTEEDVMAIEPAAGDAIEGMNIPGSMQNNVETITTEELVNLKPAAGGDAEGMNDDAVIVASDDDTEKMMQDMQAKMDMMSQKKMDEMNDQMNHDHSHAEMKKDEMVKVAEDKVEMAAETMSETKEEVAKEMTEMSNEATEVSAEMMEKAEEAVEPAAGEAMAEEKTMMEKASDMVETMEEKVEEAVDAIEIPENTTNY